MTLVKSSLYTMLVCRYLFVRLQTNWYDLAFRQIKTLAGVASIQIRKYGPYYQ